MTTKTIFISHSTKDDAQVNLISDSLTKSGHGVWVDHQNGIIPGTPSWDKAIRDAIKNADVGVFVMSENALESDICGSECLLIRELNKPLYVLRLSVCKPENIFLYIKQIQYADLVTDFEAGMQTFLDVLGGGIAQNLPTPSRAKITGGETMRQYLPFLNNPLRGRGDDLATIQTMLTQTGITQIIGVGGWGKSRISAEIALAYPQGAVWHRCSSVSSAGDLLYTLRRHFDLPDDIPQDNILVLLDTHRPLVVIDNAEDVAPKSDRRAGYVDLLGKIAGLGVPVLLTSRTKWNEFRNSKSYKPSRLNKTTAEEITKDFAKNLSINLSIEQVSELTEAAHNHPYLIERVVRLSENSIIPYKILIQYLKDLSYDDMQNALNEMILKTINQMRTDSANGEDAYSLLRNLTLLQPTFSFDAIKALKPDNILNDKQLLQAIETLGNYVFLDYKRDTERYHLESLVKETISPPDDENTFNKYADFYINRAKEIFVDLKEQPELWDNYPDDIENILSLGEKLSELSLDSTSKHLQHYSMFSDHTRHYIYRYPELKLVDWLERGLDATRLLREDANQNIQLIITHANLSITIGAIYLQKKTNLALPYFEESSKLYEQVNEIQGLCHSLTNIGAYYASLGDYKLAENYLNKVLHLRDVNKYPYDLANTLGNFGNIFFELKRHNEAMDCYNKALSIFEKLNRVRDVLYTLNGIGNIYFELRDYEKSQNIYYHILMIAHNSKDKRMQAQAFGGLGNVFLMVKDYNTAIIYYRLALEAFIEVENKREESGTLYNLAIIFYQHGDLNKAIEYYEQAVDTTYPFDPRLPKWREGLTRLKALRDGSA